MRFFTLTLLVALALGLCCPNIGLADFCEVEWTEMAELPIGTNSATAAADGDNVFVVSGYDTTAKAFTDAIHIYSIGDDSWTAGEPIPTARTEACNTAMIDQIGKFCVIGGHIGGNVFTNAVECYDPDEDEWSALDNLPQALAGVFCAVHEDVIYVTGGWNGATHNTALWYLDTAGPGAWVEAANPRPVYSSWGYGGIVEEPEEKGYWFTQLLGFTAEVAHYSLADGSWSEGADYTENRIYACGLNLGQSQLMLLGGALYPSYQTNDAILVYDAFEDEWYEGDETMPQSRASMACVMTADDEAFIIGGYSMTKDIRLNIRFSLCLPHVDDPPDEAKPGDELNLSGSGFTLGTYSYLHDFELNKYYGLNTNLLDYSHLRISIPQTGIPAGDYHLGIRNLELGAAFRFRLRLNMYSDDDQPDDDQLDDDQPDDDQPDDDQPDDDQPDDDQPDDDGGGGGDNNPCSPFG